MTTIFDEVHGFNLKLPYTSRDYNSGPFGEWIEIIKKPNELPTVKLKTLVLYYRNDGLDTGISSNNANIKTSVTGATVDDGNYRFYNDLTSPNANGRQLGWIWGFPLFDVGRSSTNWPRFHSCIGGASDISGNQIMLVDISSKKDIIVLNFEGLGSTIFNDISNNIPGIDNAFFMTLRIKSSTESDFSSYDSTKGRGHGGSWNLWDNNTQMVTRWASIIQYEYECDIIGPKAMLDFTLNYFMYNNSGKGEIINNNNSSKELLQLESGNNNINNYTELNSLSILTGLGINQQRYRMDIEDILKHLSRTISNSSTNPYDYKFIQIKERCITGQFGRDGANTIKLIGGWYNRGRANSNNERNIGYYGDNFGLGNRQTKMNLGSTETEGWKRFINFQYFSTPTSNRWIDNSSNSFYEFNNILWCSLRSPRKIPVTKRKTGSQDNTSYGIHRFITNFIDLSGLNKIIGGGYGRYSNTIDMPRQSVNPYFSSDVTQNNNTVSIANFNENENINYLDADSTALTLDDLNYFTVYYKLLVPLDAGKEFNIKYTFGRDSNCVTTFVRHNDMSGNSTPPGNENLNAVRNEESIELTWDDSSMDGNGNMPIQPISFTDIASGFKKVSASFNITDVSLNQANNSTEYDISFNVFQFHFFATVGNTIVTDRQEIPYSVKAFDTNITVPQVIDISYVPQNYEPYRYVNYKEWVDSGGQGVNVETGFYFDKSEYSNGPFEIIEENLKLKLAKYYAKTGNNLGNLKSIPSLIDPSNTKFIPNDPPQNIIEIDISSNVYDNSFSLLGVTLPEEAMSGSLPAPANFPISKEEIIFLSITDTNQKLLENKEEAIEFQDSAPNSNKIGLFYSPNALDLSGYLIPDYWRLPDKINTLRKTGLNDSPQSYQYFSIWEQQAQIAMVLDILSISIKFEDKTTNTPAGVIEYLLVNTNVNSSDYSAMTSGGVKINNASSNIIFEVQGANGLINGQYLNQKPIIVQLFTKTSGPFGPTAKAFIGNKNGPGTTGNPPATADKGINVPYPVQPGLPANNSNYIVNDFLPGILRKGNGIAGANLGVNEKSYNDAYDINLSAWDDGGSNIQNASFNGTSMSPSPLKTLLVDLPNVSQTNPTSVDMINDANNAITIKWTSFFFSSDVSWITQNSNVFWTITKTNIATAVSTNVLTDEILSLNGNNEYFFIDTNVKIFDKIKYTVTGSFKWIELSNIAKNDVPSLSIPGFETPECFACKFNRFKYGRFNTTSTNLKLFRPLLINTAEGQVNQFNERTCGGGCRDPNNPQLNLYASGSRISSSNNIYANTTNQVSKKQTYVILAKSRFRPFR